MNVLALDTCTEQGSVALARDGAMDELSLPPGWKSATLHLEITRLLEQHGLTTRNIDGYAVTSGPGSFTGVRVGLTAVKGLAEVHRKPIAAISTLQTLAAAAMLSGSVSRGTPIVALLDARRGQVFGGVYREAGGEWKTVLPDSVCSLAALLERIKSGLTADPSIAAEAPLSKLVFCAIDPTPFVSEIEKAGMAGAALIRVSSCLAGPLARIAVTVLQQGRGADAAGADANYVRLSDAELFWREP